LRAGHFVDQVAVDVQEHGAVGFFVHHMALPNLRNNLFPVPENNDVGSCLRPCYQYGTKARSLCRIEILFS
jgi:hypothetical protein